MIKMIRYCDLDDDQEDRKNMFGKVELKTAICISSMHPKQNHMDALAKTSPPLAPRIPFNYN